MEYTEHVKQIKYRKPGQNAPELSVYGAEGQNRTADTGFFNSQTRGSFGIILAHNFI